MGVSKRAADVDVKKITPEPGASMRTTVRVWNENGGT